MAIKKTGDIFNTLKYGSVKSEDYGVYITGEAVYNVPTRAVDILDVPGRNGAVVIDQNRWDNIIVEYPAGVFGNDQADFRTLIRAFRNALASQTGYHELSDTYHPDEYRQGLYVDGMEVEPHDQGRVGEFTIRFNCKPQRWLTSGKTQVTMTNGGDLTNPTLYPAHPLLGVRGYGQITIGSKSLRLVNDTLGHITLLYGKNVSSYSATYNGALVSSGDDINVGGTSFYFDVDFEGVTINSIGTPSESGAGVSAQTIAVKTSDTTMRVATTVEGISFINGTASTQTHTTTITVNYGSNQTTTLTAAYTFGHTTGNKITIQRNMTYSSGLLGIAFLAYSVGDITAESTASALGNPTYIDLETGNAYYYTSPGVPAVSANKSLMTDAELPDIPAESTVTITYGENITALYVTPRWWQL